MKKMLRVIFAALLLAAPTAALAQSSPGLVYGQVPTAAQWNSYFASKVDYPLAPFTLNTVGGVPAPGTVSGRYLGDDGAWHTPAAGGVSSFNTRSTLR